MPGTLSGLLAVFRDELFQRGPTRRRHRGAADDWVEQDVMACEELRALVVRTHEGARPRKWKQPDAPGITRAPAKHNRSRKDRTTIAQSSQRTGKAREDSSKTVPRPGLGIHVDTTTLLYPMVYV